jgi:hypothetical protein
MEVRAMKVLLLESYHGLGRAAAEQLSREGHQVLRCEATDRSAPCRGLETPGECPLDDDDVAVAVLATTGGELQPGEHGAVCAARQRIPLVTTSMLPEPGAFERLATAGGFDLIAACEAAARSGAPHATAVVRELLRRGTVDPEDVDGSDPPITVTVDRSPRRLSMTLRIPANDPRQAAIVKSAAEALRAYDRHVPVIDVSVVR